MSAREQSLKAFYSGPVWKAHRDAANATMIDWDNVSSSSPSLRDLDFRSTTTIVHPASTETYDGFEKATIYCFDSPVNAKFISYFENTMQPALMAGATLLTYFVTEDGPNTFPALPIREGENVFVWFGGFQDQAAYDSPAALTQSPRWRDEISKELARRLKREPEMLKLSPTTRSLL